MSIDMNPNYIGWSIVDWNGENRDYLFASSEKEDSGNGYLAVNTRKYAPESANVPEIIKVSKDINSYTKDKSFYQSLLSYDKDIELRCLCSSGTYIRSLCVDIAEKLGQKGILSMFCLDSREILTDTLF
jgi:hypothetical protein